MMMGMNIIPTENNTYSPDSSIDSNAWYVSSYGYFDGDYYHNVYYSYGYF